MTFFNGALKKLFFEEQIAWYIRLFQKFCLFLWVYFKLLYLSEYLFIQFNRHKCHSNQCTFANVTRVD